MKILHIDLRTLSDDYADLRYGWENLNDFTPRRLPLADIQDLIAVMERDYYVALPEDYVQTGQRLYQWLDGADRWLAQLLASAQTGVVLAIATTEKLGHLPWEVLHDGNSFLVARPFPIVLPVRWQSGSTVGSANQALTWQPKETAANRPLQALFMATSPIGVEPVLDFEIEEGRILDATKRQPMALTVEESGCLDELENLLNSYEPGHFDVVHLTGHAWISEEGPRFIAESETGAQVDASAQEIARALQFRFPPLMFLSGCRTGQRSRGGEVPSMAAMLLSQGATAVLGWGRPVLDKDGILAAETLYAALASAKTLAEGLAQTYQAMIEAKTRDWHLLRLYVAGALPQNLVTPLRTKKRQKAQKASMTTVFLDPAGKVKVPDRGSFVGRRRPLQNCLRSLQDPDLLGVLLHGMGGLGKSSVAARLCDRLTDYTRIVWFGSLDESALVNQLGDEISDSALRQHLQDPAEALKFRLKALFEAEGTPTFLLVLDDFEANLESVGEGFRLKPEAARVMGALVWALEKADADHRVMITCRYRFEFSGLSQFYLQPLAGLQAADLQKKCRQLAAFGEKSTLEQDLREQALGLADGNPRLLEWLDKLLLAPETVDVSAVLDALAGERQEELREQVLAAALLAQMDEPLRAMLTRARVYELPVPRAAIVEVCADLVGVEKRVDRAVALGLLEQSPEGALRVPRVLPLAVEESTETAAGLAAQAAQVLYRLWLEEAAQSSELQCLEIHRLALVGKDADIAKKVGDSLTNSWNNKSRYRESVELCRKTISVVRDYALLHNLARAERQLGNTTAAIQLYKEALNNCSDSDEKEKASILHNWAGLKAQQGDIDGAIALYQQSLEIQEKIGDAQGKAATLHQLAILKAQQGDIDGAITLYQQSLEIKEKIGNAQGKAATLHCLAILKAQQGDIDGAITLYQQSLEIQEKIGDAQGKAATLHQLAILKAQQGDIDGAITLYQQSLEIEEKIGNAQGKAATLHCLAILKAQQGDIDGAITLYQQSLEIKEKIGDAQGKAATLAMLGQLLADAKGETKTALNYLHQSLEILQKIVPPSARTVEEIIKRISGAA